jgi:hypothetical protein
MNGNDTYTRLAGNNKDIKCRSHKNGFGTTPLKIVLLGLFLLVGPWGTGALMAGETTGEEGKDPMQISTVNPVSLETIPSIDVAAPETTKTATFAMG